MTEPLNFKPAISDSLHFNPATTALNEGALTVLTDTQDVYVDTDDIRIKLSDVVTGTYAAITNQSDPVLGKIYFAVDTHQLLQAYRDNGSVVWHELGGYDESGTEDIIYDSGAVVSLTLNTRKIYYLTNNNITSISLTAASNLSYCTLCLTGGTNTSFSPPVGARCIGHDCYGGVFYPASGREYQIAIDVLNNVITFYVLSINLNTGLIPTDSTFNTNSTNPISNNVVASAVNTLSNGISTLTNTKSDVSTVVTNNSASVSLTLSDNTIYRCTNSAITDLTIAGVSSGFAYATITFTSPADTPTTFAVPATGYYCSGVECDNGIFTPIKGMRYNLAVENEGDRIAIYVMEAL